MKESKLLALRESSDFLIKQAKSCTTQSQLQIVRNMLEGVILSRYKGQFELAHEYSRVDIELRRKERELGPLEMPTMEFNNN
jgi:hypothetical protein